MDTRSWLAAVAEQTTWGAKYRSAFLRYADRLGPAFTASTFRDDSARAVAACLLAFPTLDELKGTIASAMPDVLAARGGGLASADQAAPEGYEGVAMRRLLDGAHAPTILSMVKRLAGQDAWDRLAERFAPRHYVEEMQDRRERAEGRTRRVPPVRAKPIPTAYQRSAAAQGGAAPGAAAVARAARRLEVNERAMEADLERRAARGDLLALRRLEHRRRRTTEPARENA